MDPNLLQQVISILTSIGSGAQGGPQGIDPSLLNQILTQMQLTNSRGNGPGLFGQGPASTSMGANIGGGVGGASFPQFDPNMGMNMFLNALQFPNGGASPAGGNQGGGPSPFMQGANFGGAANNIGGGGMPNMPAAAGPASASGGRSALYDWALQQAAKGPIDWKNAPIPAGLPSYLSPETAKQRNSAYSGDVGPLLGGGYNYMLTGKPGDTSLPSVEDAWKAKLAGRPYNFQGGVDLSGQYDPWKV